MSAADILALVRKAAAATLNAQAEVAQKATRDLVPKDTHELEKSIKVSKARANGLVSQVYSDLDYSIVVHEDLGAVHPNGRSKFMEAAVIEQRAAIEAAGAKAAKDVLG